MTDRQKRPKVVFIDWSQTLSSSKFWGHLQVVTHPYHGLFKKIQDSLFTENNWLLDHWMRGRLSSEEVIGLISTRTKIEKCLLFGEFVRSCRKMQFDTPDALGLVDQLRSGGVKVVIATDNMDSFRRWTIPALKLGDKFDEILDSFSLKAMKKDLGTSGESLFFGSYLRRLNLSYEQSVLIDDSKTTGDIVRRLGMKYLQVEKSLDLPAILMRIFP